MISLKILATNTACYSENGIPPGHFDSSVDGYCPWQFDLMSPS
jgi:hypothetical protein